MARSFVCIDLKSFYASVECVSRGLDPLTTNLVVADESRTEKTICLAVSPSLKAYGIPGRARLFEVNQRVREINYNRKFYAPGKRFVGKSWDDVELKKNPGLELDVIRAVPRMGEYMRVSANIYNVYLKYLAPEDIFVYSIDEIFADVTDYLGTYKMTAKELVTKIIRDVLETTGITATSGIGTNPYLAKVAMDISAKHIKADKFGVRIAELDEMSYRRLLWNHTPITDFWRVGKGYSKKLQEHGMVTMGDVARCSVYNEDLLYKLFGINAELLIDHAWGWEPCTIKDIKAYKPNVKCVSSGQVLHCAYDFEKTRLIVKEMTDALALDLVSKGLVTDQIVLDVGYDIENLTNSKYFEKYKGEITIDRYGRSVPKHAHGTINLKGKTASTKELMEAVMELYERIVDKNLLCRRINITANKLITEEENKKNNRFEQIDLFSSLGEEKAKHEVDERKLSREKNLQKAVIGIKSKYGKNAILKGMNFEEGGTMIERNGQIGGHKE